MSDVNGLVNRFFDARKMMSSLASGKMPGHAGPARDAGRRTAPAAKPKKKKGGRGVSGNPAKRNAPRRAGRRSTRRRRSAPAATMDEAALQKAMAEFELPPELRSRFGQ